jgi:hypothetical protein
LLYVPHSTRMMSIMSVCKIRCSNFVDASTIVSA